MNVIWAGGKGGGILLALANVPLPAWWSVQLLCNPSATVNPHCEMQPRSGHLLLFWVAGCYKKTEDKWKSEVVLEWASSAGPICCCTWVVQPLSVSLRMLQSLLREGSWAIPDWTLSVYCFFWNRNWFLTWYFQASDLISDLSHQAWTVSA